MAGERNQPGQNSILVTWEEDPPDGNNSYLYSPSWAPTSPFMSATISLAIAAGDTFTSFRFGLQGSVDWDGDDSAADWFTLVRPDELHGSGNSNPAFGTGAVSLWLDAAITNVAGAYTFLSPIDANPDVDQVVPVIAPRIRIACFVNGDVDEAGATEWTITTMESIPS